jgi:RNA recognition motif-containing protein
MASTSATTLDDLIPSPTSKDVVPLPPRDDHLFYPSLDDDETAGRDTPPVETRSRQMLTDRLYIGNLHPSVDESAFLIFPCCDISDATGYRYTLLQVFSKFGRVTKLDYLFHKTGLLKGKPRGYAFIEYADKDVSIPVLFISYIFLSYIFVFSQSSTR